MKKNISIITLAICVIIAVIVTFAATFTVLGNRHSAELAKAYEENVIEGTENPASDIDIADTADEEPSFYEEKLKVIEAIFDMYSYYELDTEAILDSMIDGFAYGTGDKYAEYYTKEEFELLTAEKDGEMQGIGINIIFNTDYKAIEVINVMPDSPALEAGVLPGDLIVTVGTGENAKSVAELGYNPALTLLQGEAGTVCEFSALRGADLSEKIDFAIERRIVTVQTVIHHVYETDKSVGVIRIMSFDGVTPNQFYASLDALMAEGVTKFVFDVRNNPGGSLDAICDILDYILPEGPIIHTKNKAGSESVINSGPEELDIPIVVLCNGNTASAAELFTSALMDYDKAVSVGQVTYGKGSMQTLFPLADGSGIKFTTKMYFPPYSEGYDGVGITPDIVVDMAEEFQNVNLFKIADKDDAQLQRAVQYLNENY